MFRWLRPAAVRCGQTRVGDPGSRCTVYRVQIQACRPVTAQLVKLDAAPDLVEQVHRVLLDAISAGTLAPGERLTQEDIARRLAVSRQPVLQALRLLKKDGLVLDAPGRGVLVAPLDAGWIASVYQVRGALDVLAARLAAERRAVLDAKLIERGRKAARGRHVQAQKAHRSRRSPKKNSAIDGHDPHAGQ